MTEIKSSLELALERSERMTISTEEREEIKRKEIFQKATGLLHRFLEGNLPLNEILKELQRMDEKTRLKVKEMLLSQWINALTLNSDHERLLKGIESLKNRGIDEPREKLLHLTSQYQREKEKARQEMRAQWIETLRREEISGNAVQPYIEGSREWRELLEAIDHPFKVKIEEVKEILRGL